MAAFGQLFYCIGNSVGIPYSIKSPAGQDSTAVEEQMALETPLYRQRILQTGFFIQTKELEMETQ